MGLCRRARINRSTDWNGARGHDDNFALLIYFRVKWATHNTQLAYNAALDASGYYQGGMGSGTTNLTYAKWNGYNTYAFCFLYIIFSLIFYQYWGAIAIVYGLCATFILSGIVSLFLFYYYIKGLR